jgi:hypothetical protein
MQNDENRLTIRETNYPIIITITIPLDYQGSANYRLIRVHDGVGEYLPTEYDPANHTLSFSTDRFSTYAVMHFVSSADTTEGVPGDSVDNSDGKGPESTQGEDDSNKPKGQDGSDIVLSDPVEQGLGQSTLPRTGVPLDWHTPLGWIMVLAGLFLRKR